MKPVFIVDDHTAIREGFKAILERSGRYGAGGEASSAEAALEAIDALPAAAGPEFYIVDISLPGMSGLELAERLRRRHPGAPVVVLSMHRRFDYIAGAFRAGASAYVAKDAGADCIIAALDAAATGSYYLDPASLRLFVDEASRSRAMAEAGVAAQRMHADEEPGRARLEALSEREREIFDLLAGGRRAEEIAERLSLSQKTVENHLSNITAKLGISSRFELYRIAARAESPAMR